jgi:hypothetical protein
MFRRFWSLSAGALVLLLTIGAPHELHAQHGHGGFRPGARSGFDRRSFQPGFGGFDRRFDRRSFRRDFDRFDRRFDGRFFGPGFGGSDPRFDRRFFRPGFAGL